MFKNLKNWFTRSASSSSAQPSAHAGSDRELPLRDAESTPDATDAGQPEYVDADPRISGRIESNGPGKNVLVRNRYQREETGTYETLRIVDDSLIDSGEETGIDPYNTGNFDRSRNWDKRRN